MTESAAARTETFWLDAWYQGRWWLWLLWPLSLLLRLLAAGRRRWLQARAQPLPVPVLVIGNITLGGTGKTPVLIALALYLQQRGFRPGVISRGYGGNSRQWPLRVTPDLDPQLCGDEPLLIAREAGCPVMVGPERVASARRLIEEDGCDIILSDDGLQHYRLARQWEVCLLDGQRGLGNGLCLPAGPLREPPARLRQVDAVLINGEAELSLPVSALRMQLQPIAWRNVLSGESRPLDPPPFAGADSLHAVTGIGNPQRFFDSLARLGLSPATRAFPDHHPFVAADLAYVGRDPLLMTAKDAVKCQSFAGPDWWYLAVEAQLPEAFYRQLDLCLQRQSSAIPTENLQRAP